MAQKKVSRETSQGKRTGKSVGHFDGILNAITNLGVAGADKRMGATAQVTFITPTEAENIWQASDIAARLIDRPVDEMLREGFDINILDNIDDKQAIITNVLERFDQLNATDRIDEGLKWSMIYGGAGTIIGSNLSPSEPFDLKKFKKIDYLVTVERRALIASATGLQGLNDEAFGYPSKYKLSLSGVNVEKNQVDIHYTHLLRWDGIKLPPNLMKLNQYWGDSVYSRLWNAIRNYETGHDSVATILQDFAQGIFKIKGLREILSAEDGDTLLAKKLELVSLTTSICNMAVLEEGEEYERKGTPVAGLESLVNKIDNRLVAGSEMPHTIILGESPNASNGTGNSTTLSWYDAIKNMQKKRCKKQIKKIVELIFAEKDGPTSGVVPKFDIVFRPLWQRDDIENAQIYESTARADEVYNNMGVLDPDTIRASRFKPQGFSLQTEVNTEEQTEIDDTTPDPDFDKSNKNAGKEAQNADSKAKKRKK